MFDVDATIVAVATARAEAIRGIVRIAGPRTVEILSTLWLQNGDLDQTSSAVPRVLTAVLQTGDVLRNIPCDIYLWTNSRSYTRQPAAEIHTFGSAPVLNAVTAALCRAGARLARPGEFTMRAFLAGRLDLTQAEAVLGVIDATTQTELQVALKQLAGGLGAPLHALRERLLDLLAHLEAGLDFVDEDIEFISAAERRAHLRHADDLVQQLLLRIGTRSETSGEPRVVLRGLPNVGKSSLFNALVGSNRSMVSHVPSTTRDFLSCKIQVNGSAVLLVDTAGVECTGTPLGISNAAQQMATEQSTRAALQLICLDATRPLTEWELQEIAHVPSAARIIVLTKCDQPRQTDFNEPSIATSSSHGTGLESLREAISHQLDATLNVESSVVNSTAVRCAVCLRRAAESLQRARELVLHHAGDELVAADLRVALDELGEVVGAVYTEDILDRVFGRFCIGK